MSGVFSFFSVVPIEKPHFPHVSTLEKAIIFQEGDLVLLKLTPQIWKKATDKRYHKNERDSLCHYVWCGEEALVEGLMCFQLIEKTNKKHSFCGINVSFCLTCLLPLKFGKFIFSFIIMIWKHLSYGLSWVIDSLVWGTVEDFVDSSSFNCQGSFWVPCS